MDLILKDVFKLGSDGVRVNKMKLRLRADGSIQIWVQNGDIRFAQFVLRPDKIAELKAWLALAAS